MKEKKNRYIKVSIVCVSSNKDIIEIIDNKKTDLKDSYIEKFNTIGFSELQEDRTSKIKKVVEESISDSVGIEGIDVYITDLVLPKAYVMPPLLNEVKVVGCK